MPDDRATSSVLRLSRNLLNDANVSGSRRGCSASSRICACSDGNTHHESLPTYYY